jgi:hypothetical protein
MQQVESGLNIRRFAAENKKANPWGWLFFMGSRVVKQLWATRCSENNFTDRDVHDPNFLVLGMGHAFGRHRNGQREVFIQVAGMGGWQQAALRCGFALNKVLISHWVDFLF